MKKVFVFIFLFALLGIFYSLDLFSFTNPAEVKKFVLSYGVYAPIIFIVLFTFVPLTLFPDAILAIAGGLIFGLVQGSLYIMIGALLGASLSFFLARFYADWLRKKLQGEKFLNIDKSVKQNGFIIIFLLRLIPLVPFDIISYSAGFSSIRYKDFILATLLGIIPGVVVYANIGAQSLEFGSNNFYFSVALLIGLIVVSLFFKKSVKKRLENENV
jgi:uncharacterized membrane protein YdjX (TVP38/TMEM64 family)